MKGLIVVNKPINKTSRDVVNFLTSFFQYKKIGHTGTLDPIATGTLVCLIGSYTKLTNLLTAIDKEYIAEIKLGIKTDTLDITGNILEQEKVRKITKDEILKVFQEFPKTYDQMVPIYSAVKINGERLYNYARQKKDITLPKRKVNIYNLELLDFHDDIIKFKTLVSKGTYIRSLINDICFNLKVLGTMNSLVRTKQGNFAIENSFTLEDIKNNNYKLLKVKDFLDYPIIEVDKEIYSKINNGNKINNIYNIKDKVIFTYLNEDIAIYEKEKDMLKQFLKL